MRFVVRVFLTALMMFGLLAGPGRPAQKAARELRQLGFLAFAVHVDSRVCQFPGLEDAQQHRFKLRRDAGRLHKERQPLGIANRTGFYRGIALGLHAVQRFDHRWVVECLAGEQAQIGLLL